MVQSPTQSCEYAINSLNNHLNTQREAIKEMSEELFQTQISSVLVKLEEKDFNIGKETTRHWGEICTHKYLFDRQ